MFSDQEDLRVEEAYQRFIRAPLARVSDHVVRYVRLVIEDCERAGLRLPPDITVIYVNEPSRPATLGMACRDGGVYRLFINWPEVRFDELRKTVSHECQHIADYYAGLSMTRSELEARARAFVETGVPPLGRSIASATRSNDRLDDRQFLELLKYVYGPGGTD